VEFEVAMSAATNPNDFDLKMNLFSDGGPTASVTQRKKEEDDPAMYGG
jgi:hypothetical protein